MYGRLGEFIVRWRGWLLGCAAVIAAASLLAVPHLEFNFKHQAFFESDSDLDEFRREFHRTFPREDNLAVIAVTGGEIFRPDVLEALRGATLEMRRLPAVRRAESVATVRFPRAGASPGSLTTEPLLGSLHDTRTAENTGVDPETAEKLGELALSEPLVRGRLVSADGNAALLLAWLKDDVQETSNLEAATGDIRSVLSDHDLPDGYEYRRTGIPMLRAKIIDGLEAEQKILLPVVALLYLLALAFFFRRAAGVVLPLTVVGLAVSSTIAVLVATNSTINLVSNVLLVLVFIIGIADSIHMLTRDAEEARGGGARREATVRAVSTTGFACLATSSTTAVGFLSLVVADSTVLQNFGWQAAVGIMLAYVFTLFFLPAALSYMRPIRRPEPESGSLRSDGLVERAIEAVADAVLGRPVVAVVAAVVVCAAAGWFGSTVRPNATLLEVFRPGHPSYETTELVEEKFGGFLPLEVSLTSSEPDGFTDPKAYRRLYEFQRSAARENEVLSTRSIADYLQSAQAALLDDARKRNDILDTSRQIAQLHALVVGAPDKSGGVDQYVTRDFRHARVLLRVDDVGSRRQLELADRLQDDLDRHFGDIPGIEARLTGDAYVASVTLHRFVQDLFWSLLLAIAVILPVLVLLFRSLRLGVVSLLPNAAPLVVTAGYMGLQNIDLNTSTVVIFAIALGLAVDDTLHVLVRFRQERSDGVSTREALRRTYRGAGRAIVLTSLFLVVGLLVFLCSDFIPTRQFGELTTVAIAAALLGDLVLLPALLLLTDSRG